MGTFHHDKGPLHGMTVVVDTTGPELWVGRCDTVTDGEVVLLGADLHPGHGDGPSREDWLRRAAQVGVFPRHARVVLPLDTVSRIEKLVDLPVN